MPNLWLVDIGGTVRDEPVTKQLVLAQQTDVSGLWLESSLGQACSGMIHGVKRDMEAELRIICSPDFEK